MGDYDSDVVLWAENQARALRDAARTASNVRIDWENVAEEIESLGKSQAQELASRIGTILLHLVKLEASPATEPRVGWRRTIRNERSGIRRLLAGSPSLKQTVARVIAEELSEAKADARDDLADYDETPRCDIAALSYTEDQVLGRSFPPDWQ